MSNRARIGRMREEAAATRREKEEQRAEKAAQEPRKAARQGGRLVVVWAVKDPRGEVLSTFPYPRKDLAEAEVKRRRAADGRSYIVTREKIPVPE